jgi:DUF4097 and DUF4098 domain-containing protein YvlB
LMTFASHEVRTDMLGLRSMCNSRCANVLWPALALSAVLAAVSFAQAPPPPTLSGEEQRKHIRVVLNKDARLVADEYVDLLRQLQDVVKDYSGYLQDAQFDLIKKYRRSLVKLGDQVSQGIYDDDAAKLGTDVEQQLEQLSDLETEVRESSEVYPMRTYRLIKSLRREIAGISDLIQNDLTDRLDENEEYSEAIAEYVRAVLANSGVQVQTAPDGQTVIVVNPHSAGSSGSAGSAGSSGTQGRSSRTKSSQKSIGVAIAPPPPEDEDSVIHIGNPSIPDLPSIAHLKELARQLADRSGTQKEIEDTLSVTSPKAIIRVENRNGAISVSGTSSDQVIAHWTVSYSADSRQKEKEFASSVQLKMARQGDDYIISTLVPSLDGPNIHLTGSDLSIEVPSHNPLVITNSLGSVTVSDIQASVDITSSYSQVTVDEITGAVTVSSATGALDVSSVKGDLNLKDAYAPITVSDCRGNMEIQNAYGAVNLSACKGNLNLKNSGAVEVSDHSGDLKIDNSFGPIDIHALVGNVSATNRFQPITITDSKGNVTLDGTNSTIDLTNILGRITATNRFGQITAEEIGGPFRFNNQNGNVAVVLGEGFRGNSSINTTFGNISVSVPAGANLLLSARTQFGSINSFSPLNLLENGQTKTGSLRLGSGRDSLSLVTTNASISIDSK